MFKLEHDKVSFSYIAKIKPAIVLRYNLAGKSISEVFTPYVESVLKGVKNLSAKRKSITVKAANYPLNVLKCLVARYITVYECDPMLIDAKAFRSIFRAVIQYFTFCRWNCFTYLQEKHLTVHVDSIQIYFPNAKNDQLHNGNISFLIANNTAFCPVKITKLYFKRFGLFFGSGEKYLNFRLEKVEAGVIARPYCKLSYSTAVRDTKQLLKTNEFDSRRISEKSAKMEGVTQTMLAGASLEEMMILGRWKSINTPSHYKLNSANHMKDLARKVPV